MNEITNNMSLKLTQTQLKKTDQKDITIIGIEPHPEDKKRGGYDKVKLSDLD